jgi:UDP-N-acetylmuramoyl-L-alanyl-D-glutamate--2,6-diaminopimelate ligase
MLEAHQIPISLDRIKALFPDGEWHGIPPSVFQGVADDSRKVVKGGIFVAIKGLQTDGHLYVEKAREAGAELLIVDERHVHEHKSLLLSIAQVPQLHVPDTRKAASILAAEFYCHPGMEIPIHGVTGTKGKTTTVHLIGEMFTAAGRKPAVMGTLGIEFGDEKITTGLTTPGPIEFHSRIRSLVDSGATDIACEVSAHAGAFYRTSDVRFESVTYMNLSRDHGDHFSDTEYLDAKLAISRDAAKLNPDVHGIGNARDPHTQEFLEPIALSRRFTFAAWEENEDQSGVEADLGVRILDRSPLGLKISIATGDWVRDVSFPLIGRFNAQNAAAAASVAAVSGIDPDIIAAGLANARPVPGRLERINMGQGYLVVVDYAHAPQPAEEILAALREFTKGRLIAVMGAGGSRDRGKRPMIGEILARDCDIAVVTSDNPRDEEPFDIINDIMVGVRRTVDKRADVIAEADRRAAIYIALDRARSGDTVAILGKGHETYQIFKDETIHFDDREVAREWLEKHGYKRTE